MRFPKIGQGKAGWEKSLKMIIEISLSLLSLLFLLSSSHPPSTYLFET